MTKDEQALFFDAILLGMRTAGFIVERDFGSRYSAPIFQYEREYAKRVEDKKVGRRQMVRGDIMLAMPVMVPGDIGL